LTTEGLTGLTENGICMVSWIGVLLRETGWKFNESTWAVDMSNEELMARRLI